jgi:glycolate oxidase
LHPFGYFYPPDPASLKFSTIGGNIAENAGGPRAYKYGVTRRYVRGVTWVTPAGDVATSPMEGPASLLVGAEGTMGIVYSARLAVRPLPAAHRTSFLAAGDDRGALGVASDLLATGFVPSVLEFIDSRTMRCVGEYRSFDGIDLDQSYLFIEIDGSDDVVRGLYSLLERFCRAGDYPLTTAGSESERELLWEVRRSVSPSLARRGVTKVNEDVSLPLGRLVDAVGDIHALASELALDCYIFGHCGDGNLHVNIMTDKRRREEMGRVEQFVERLFDYVVDRGGTLSGEHGIGMTKSPYLELIFSPAELSLARRLKSAVDEDGMFNNGKYFTS